MTLFNLANLRELRIHKLWCAPEWLRASQFGNLQKFHVCLCNENGRIDVQTERILINFISGKLESLTDFECLNAQRDDVFVELSQHNPNIERLHGLEY